MCTIDLAILILFSNYTFIYRIQNFLANLNYKLA
jgi:hypothetical protein